MQQSSHLTAALPACLFAALVAAVVPSHSAEAQERYRVLSRENFRRDPDPTGGLLAAVNQGTEMVGGETRSGWIQVTLEGWIWAQSLRPLPSGGEEYDYQVSASSGENLRAGPNGPILARLLPAFWLKTLEDSGGWVRVTRTGWMWGRSLERLDTVTGSDAADGPATSVPQGDAVTTREGALDRAVSTTRSVVRRAPGGDTTGTLLPNAPVRVLARSGDWVRVQMEGWVRGTDLRPASEGVLVGVSGAEVRASPEQYEGRTLQWTLQLLSVETSDGVRRELPVGRRYMLARGPLPEVGFVYVLLQDDQVAEMQRLSPLSEVVTLVLVRVGGDRFLGNPVVELIDMSVREP